MIRELVKSRKLPPLASVLQLCQRSYASALPEQVNKIWVWPLGILPGFDPCWRFLTMRLGQLQVQAEPVGSLQPDFSYTPPGRNHLFVPGEQSM